eukprot:scaffold177592_cov33-Prasinocladus_malaysianus.AAC.2
MSDAPPAPSGERGRGGFGRGFGGRGRGDRGRGRGRGRGQKEEEKWVPCTKLGRLVQQGIIVCEVEGSAPRNKISSAFIDLVDEYGNPISELLIFKLASCHTAGQDQ